MVDDRPLSVGPKRMREWEDESVAKKQANEENRARLDDLRHRRPSTPPRDVYRRNSSEARRPDDQRRVEESRRPDEPRHKTESYHPSEAAHHPQNHSVAPSHLPPMQQGPNPLPGPPHDKPQPAVTPKEERPQTEPAPPARPTPAAPSEPERAARKMDVDEDYDDSAEEEKKGPAGLANGSGPTSAAKDLKPSTPATASVNGASGPLPKTE